jgi:hypothetical protein
MNHDPRSSSLWRRAQERGTPDPSRRHADDELSQEDRRVGSDDVFLPPFPEAHSGSSTAASSHSHWRGRGAATDPDYLRWRNERLREFDADYEAWCRERYDKFCSEFGDWRRQQAGERSEPRLHLGARDDGAPTEEPSTFFERS